MVGRSTITNKRYIKERDGEILSLHYGFETNSHETFEKIAQQYGISRERIRQIHQKSLKKIKYAGLRNPDATSSKLISVLKQGISSTSGEDDFQKIINFYNTHLIGLSAEHALKFIAYFYFDSFEIQREIVIYYKDYEKQLRRNEFLLFKAEQHKHILLEKQSRIFSKVTWFDTKKKWNLNREFKPARKVTEHPLYTSGEFYSHKSQRMIQYESTLEKKFIEFLEEAPEVISYVDQPVTLRCTTETGRTLQYTPDFLVFLQDKTGFFVEIKTLQQMVVSKVEKKLQVLINYCKENGFGILLTDGEKTLIDIIKRDYNRILEKIILDKLAEKKNRIIFYKEYKRMMTENNSWLLDFIAIVLLNRLDYYDFPLRLTNKNRNTEFYKYINQYIK